jgi:serine/threonine-protein kinase PRP4
MTAEPTKGVSVPRSPSPTTTGMAHGVSNSTSMAASRATSVEQNSSSAAASPHASADFHIPDVSAADFDPVQEQKENIDRAAQNAETVNVDQDADDGLSDDMFADDFDVNRVDNKPRELDMNLIEDHDDEGSYYRITVHELIDNRYVVRGELGKGSYAVVVLAFDKVTKKDIALKIFRKNDHIRQAGLKEVDTLKRLIDADSDCDQHIVGFYRSFYYKKHLCLIFERLDGDVRGLVKTAGHGLTLPTVIKLAKDMFLALDFLKRCKFIHADLKPDNMLFYNNRQNLKFGDLGIAYKAADAVLHPMDNAGSRFYRSPEALLGIPHSYGIDIWAIACSLYEVFSGQVLFPGRHNNEMLEAIMDVRGKIPHSLQKRGKLSWHHFNQIDGLFKQAIELDTEGRPYSWRVRTDIRQHPARDIRARVLAAAKIKNLDTEETKKARQFADLLDKCLRMDPEKRIGPSEALQHPLFENI